MSLSAQQGKKAMELLAQAKTKIAKIREQGEEMAGDAALMIESSATAYGLGYAHTRWGERGEMKVAGLPVDAVLGVAMLGLRSFGALGKQGEHGRNVAVGALNVFAARSGAEQGARAAADDHDDSVKRTLASGGRPAAGLGAGSFASSTGSASGQTYVVSEKT